MKVDRTAAGRVFPPTDTFVRRHLGPSPREVEEMLEAIGFASLEALGEAVVPEDIRFRGPLALGAERGERELLEELAGLAARNEVRRSLIGLGYHDTITPPVILRNVLENPGWYTQYTPYQAEIAQGRLEALLNFQTAIAELTGLPLTNASLLDEATAAAEAMTMCRAIGRDRRSGFLVSPGCHPQTIEVVRARAEPLGITLHVADPEDVDLESLDLFGVLVQLPDTDGRIRDLESLVTRVHEAGALVVVAADPLALTLLRPPGELGADVAIGSAQRFGVPLGYGGPHAAYIATREEYKRQVPGRIVGVSQDAAGRPALRLAMQTREQHIRRDKATSNICTAQVLLAVMAGMYVAWHGREGLREIALRLRRMTETLARGLTELGHEVAAGPRFDTLRVRPRAETDGSVRTGLERAGINLREYPGGDFGIALDETCGDEVLHDVLVAFGASTPELARLAEGIDGELDEPLRREGAFLDQPVFSAYRTEHEMLRYLHRLQGRDLSLTQSMIPLGSCTMKLNGTSQMIPVSWPGFARVHPFAPAEQTLGYRELFERLAAALAEITGFAAVSLQPNAGAQGEYAGLLVIRAYHHARGDRDRDVCLIPTSAHGTNPASAVLAGMRVVAVACDDHGNIDLDDLRARADQHREKLSALMVTYPSTHGVFEEGIREICEIVHARGGQVYLDGANMNAQVGLCRPGDYGADVCHLNLHKTFCIPHGGGGPGMGPIAAASHLAPFLPGHPLAETGGERAIGPVSAAPWGSAGILPIPWVYIALMGAAGLTRASRVAILNANYVAACLRGHYDVLFTGREGLVAHEFVVDTRPFRELGVTVDDIAKRLMDFGIHAPTMSWPVAGTLMIEPTESESKEELDRFCDAMIAIRAEIEDIRAGRIGRDDSPLKHAPHPASVLVADEWPRRYSRETAAFPLPWVRDRKFWPAVGRIDNAWGDRNLVCTCPSVEELSEA